MGCMSFVSWLGSIVVFVCSFFSQSNPLCLPRAARSASPYRAGTCSEWRRGVIASHLACRSRVISHDISQVPVVQKVDSAIYWINHYPVDNAIGLRITYPLDSDIYPVDTHVHVVLSNFWTTGARSKACSQAIVNCLQDRHCWGW